MLALLRSDLTWREVNFTALSWIAKVCSAQCLRLLSGNPP